VRGEGELDVLAPGFLEGEPVRANGRVVWKSGGGSGGVGGAGRGWVGASAHFCL
jgi:hypothetical protein